MTLPKAVEQHQPPKRESKADTHERPRIIILTALLLTWSYTKKTKAKTFTENHVNFVYFTIPPVS